MTLPLMGVSDCIASDFDDIASDSKAIAPDGTAFDNSKWNGWVSAKYHDIKNTKKIFDFW